MLFYSLSFGEGWGEVLDPKLVFKYKQEEEIQLTFR